MTDIAEFRVEIDDDVIDDVRARLRATRWPEREPVEDWSQGTPLSYVQDVCRYWADEYDWRAAEARLNRFPQFRTSIDGLGIHFIHVRSPEPDALPLVMTHGWPGSVVEFLKVIEPLTDPVAHGGSASDAFHVVCPSLPGYGFSDKPAETGWGVQRTGRAWAELMARLGYERYGAQGGDWGSMVTSSVAAADPEHCIGIHVNMAIAFPTKADRSDPTEQEQQSLASLQYYQDEDSGYAKEQSTRPQTIGYALVDSPAGQAAWILEKFWAWTDCDGHPEKALTRDEMLDNITVYWLSGTGASSARFYWEYRLAPFSDPVEVPSGISVFPKEIFRPSRRWAETRYPKLQYWNELDRGGHFAAFEQPGLFVDEVRAGFRSLRRPGG